MSRIAANGIELEHRVLGDAGARPLILVRGLGTHMTHWDERLLDRFVDAGHRVVVFDNRDVGLSTHFPDAGTPDVAAVGKGDTSSLAYSMSDMAADVVGLMDGLGIGTAHVFGISMGGMIVQTLAIGWPQRLRSFTSVMSSPGASSLPPPTPEAIEALVTPGPTEREAALDHSVQTGRVFTGGGFPFDAERHRAAAAAAYDRAFDPDGVNRQFAAVNAHGDRTEALGSVTVPALVIHGSDDPLIPVEHGRATAAAIPGAGWLEIPGMGHDLPEGAWPRLVNAVSEHTKRHDTDRGA